MLFTFTIQVLKRFNFFYIPLLSGKVLFSKISLASVPSSIKSNLVITPMVRIPVVKIKYIVHKKNMD